MTAPTRQNISQRAAEIIQRIYDAHSAGCCWHVVLDDQNWDCISPTLIDIRAGVCRTNGACRELADLDPTPSILRRAMRKLVRR